MGQAVALRQWEKLTSADLIAACWVNTIKWDDSEMNIQELHQLFNEDSDILKQYTSITELEDSQGDQGR